MATLRTSIQISDGMSPAIRAMNNAVKLLTTNFSEMQARTDRPIDSSSIRQIQEELARATVSVDMYEREVRSADAADQKHNQTLRTASSATNGLTGSILGLVSAYGGLQGLRMVLNLSDTLTSTKSRLDLMNDGLQTTDELQKMIMQSANNSRAAYTSTAATVAKLGLLAKDAFPVNAEAVKFAELMNKQFVIGGSSIQEQTAGMHQLTQAMAAGKLQGDEFRSIMENAPMLAQAIATYTGKSMGELREMSAEGEITADVIKNALFAAADETNQKFESMPMTFEQAFTGIQNDLISQFEPLLAVIANGASWIHENWDTIEPVIWGVVAALSVYAAISGVVAVINGVTAISEATKAAATMLSTGATFAATAAQYGLNAALLASPITWIIVAIIALIAIFYGVVQALNMLTGQSISATGLIMGGFAVLGTFLFNLFLALLDFVLGIVNDFGRSFTNIANFIANVFTAPISSIIYLFAGMADNVLGLLETVAQAIDDLFGSNLADSVSGWRTSLASMANDLAAKTGETYTAKYAWEDMTAEGLGLNRMDYGTSLMAGYTAGAGVDASISSFFNGDALSGITDGMDGIGESSAYTADNTGDMADTMEYTEEDLKYLRDIAEKEAINRFTTAEINVSLGGVNNTVNQNTDLDGVVSYLEQHLYSAMVVAAEGV